MKRANRIKLALHRGVSRAFLLGPLVFLLVAGAGCPSLFESPTRRETRIRQAVVGKDGDKNVPTGTVTLNAYAALATADVNVGATSLTVATVASLATNFPGALSQGDLLLIIQMAGATIDTTETPAYGSYTVAGLGSAGRYEFVGVEAVNAGTNQITLACPLKHAYTVAGKTQVIRVPQYDHLIIGGIITAPAWDGATGGVVAVHAKTTVQLDGSINVAAKGFRGGSTLNDNASRAGTTAGAGITLYRSAANADGGEKGEGIAGYQGEYTNGRYGRGAPANAGGGGNSHNAGGGGGANAGDLAGWSNGQGVMLGSVTGAAAWLLEPAGVAADSQGGGRGGYSWSANDMNALTIAPGDATWGGDARRQVGGLGGRPVPNDPASRIFMGGGGGAGDANDGVDVHGGRGGGLVFLITGSVTGTGTIVADGEIGAGMPAVTANGDAPGGGGGGGAVVVHAAILSTVSISANGGKGGDHLGSSSANEVEGPGGGGGGGYIAVAGTGSPNRTADGALGGTTDRGALTEFPSDGATAGHAGVINGSASTFFYCGGVFTTIVTHPENPTNSTTGSFTFTNTSSPVTYECKLDTPAPGGPGTWAPCNAGDPSTPSFTTPTLTVDGTYVLNVRATDAYSNVESPVATYTWILDTTAPDTLFDTNPANPSGSATGAFTFHSTESASTFECKLDTPAGDGAWAACNAGDPSIASFTTPTLTEGAQKLSVRATDAAGNTDASPAEYPWVYSAALPVTTIDSKPAKVTKVTTGDFTFSNTKSPVTYECKLDVTGGAVGTWAACDAGGAASYTTGTLADGEYTLSVRSTYAGTVVEDPAVTYTWLIDNLAPNTIIDTNPTNPSSAATANFTFHATETPATYECKLDGPAGVGTWVACNAGDPTLASYTASTPTSGDYTLWVRATDAAGNVDDSPASYAWVVAAAGVDGGVVDAKPSDVVAATDDVAPVVAVDAEGVDVEIDAGGEDLVPIIDVGQTEDLQVASSDGAVADVLPEVQQAGPEPGADSAAPPVKEDAAVVTKEDAAPTQTKDDVAPAVKEDTAVVTKDDAAPIQTKDDAAPPMENLKVLGSGFCAIASSRSASPAGFMVLALAGLALLRRRRR